MRTGAIVLMCVFAAVVYGVIHDQITARVCVEYFTVGHPPIFPTDDPTLLGVAGLTAGLDFVEERGQGAIRKHELALCDRLRLALAEMPGFEVFGHGDPARRVGTVSFRCESLPAPELGGILDQAFDIAVRPGLHCAPYIHRALGSFPDGLVRVSPGPFNTEADIEKLIEALGEVGRGT